MYKRTTNRKTHKHYSIEEKNQIVLLYFDHHMGRQQIITEYDLSSSQLHYWITNYKLYGTCIDNRGKCTKLENKNKGRRRKTLEKPLEEYTKEELIERCRLLEDIKKSVACLETSKQKKSIKS